jgi:glycosyltransferase involved in cell wall biosynthesis
VSLPLLFVSGEYPPDVGGIADYTHRLREALAQCGWSSRVLSRADVGRWDLRALFALSRVAPRRGIVHIQYQPAAFDLLGDVCLMPTLLHRVRPRVKVVTTFHDARVPYLFPKAGSLRRIAVQLLARSSDAVIAADEGDLRTIGVLGFDVPIGSNVDCAPPDDYDRAEFRRSRLGTDDDTLVVAYFGLLNSTKGLDLLFDAFTRIASQHPDARLVLLGGDIGASDPTNAATAARVRSRLTRSVVHTGWLPPRELSAYLLASDVALLPYTDGASARRGSLLACAAHGLPIVSTLPAAPEVADAILAVEPTAAALANAVLSAATERARWRAASGALTQRHSWVAIAREHAAIYAGLT